jgi:GT2 family glycosyltransferase
MKHSINLTRRFTHKIKNIKSVYSRAVYNATDLRHKQVLIEERDRLIRRYAQSVKRNDSYQAWMQNSRVLLKHPVSEVLKYRPLISIVMPTYNTDKNMLIECIESVFNQTYDNWELCIADDASTNKETLDTLRHYESDDRIKVAYRKDNGHICASTNTALKLASGEFISLLDHDDVIEPNALEEVVKVLNKDNSVDFIYTDEDKMKDGYYRHDPFPKPDWSPEFLLSCNYITHFSTIRKSIIDEIGGFREGTEGAQDWDLFLRVSEKTNKIAHIPQFLYHWRIHSKSTAGDVDAKDYITKNQTKVLQDALARRNINADIQESNVKWIWNVIRRNQTSPLVSIVIPTKDNVEVFRNCIESIESKTTYSNYEIIVVDTGSRSNETHAYYKDVKKRFNNIRFIDFVEERFSYSNSCNKGASEASGDYLLMLNNDTEVITPDWIEKLLAHAEREEVGAVGCRLYYPNKWIQHAGVVLGLGAEHGGVAGHALHTHERTADDYAEIFVESTRDLMAVTAACLMVSKKKYEEVGGFDPLLRVTFNDVDLCLKLTKNGYKSIYVPYVELYHHESLSVGKGSTRDAVELKEAADLMLGRWQNEIAHDPYYNDNLSKIDGFYMFKQYRELKEEIK